MKKVIKIVSCFVIVILAGYLTVNLYTVIKLNDIKEKIIEKNPEITKMETMNSVGQWGEWFSEYTLIVEMNGLKYRIWISEEGEISDKEAL